MFHPNDPVRGEMLLGYEKSLTAQVEAIEVRQRWHIAHTQHVSAPVVTQVKTVEAPQQVVFVPRTAPAAGD